MSHVHAFSCICTFNSLYFDIHCAIDTFLIVSLSPSISLSCVSCFMAPKHKSTPSQNRLHSGASSPLILHRLLFSSMMREPVRTSRRTSLNEAFIQNAKSFCLISLILHFPLSSTVGVESHFMAPQSLVHP